VHENVKPTSYSYAEDQDGEAEHEEEAYEEYADAQESFHTSEDAHAREEADQVVVANDEPETVLEVDVIHEGSADPESTEDQECDELCENEVFGDAEAAGTITVPITRDKENIGPNPELDAGGAVPTEARKPLAEGKSAQLGVSEGRSLIVFLHLFLVTHVSQKNRLPTLNFLEPAATWRKSLMYLQVCRSSPSYNILLIYMQRMSKRRPIILAKI
jgi:hypothetical protein